MLRKPASGAVKNELFAVGISYNTEKFSNLLIVMTLHGLISP